MTFSDQVASIDRAVQDHLDGTAVSYQPTVGGPVALVGMFDENYVLVDVSEPDAESVGPSVFLDKANINLLAVHPDDDDPTLTINGLTYKARESQPDGMGGLRLILHRTVL